MTSFRYTVRHPSFDYLTVVKHDGRQTLLCGNSHLLASTGKDADIIVAKELGQFYT